MKRKRWFPLAVSAAAFFALFPFSCAAGFRPPSEVDSLRVLAVAADKPHARPGDEVTFSMTVADALRAADGTTQEPRPIQVLWVGGCFNPEGDLFFLCFEQLSEQFQSLGLDDLDTVGSLVGISFVPPEGSGEPGYATFTTTVPEDVLAGREGVVGSATYAVGYVFFAACAGTLYPGDPDAIEAWTGEGTPEFPVKCLDAEGNEQGADSFVPGYTQLTVFADGRTNDNPPIVGMTIDDVAFGGDPQDIPTVRACAKSDDQRRRAGCIADTGPDCGEYRLQATIGDVAEVNPDAFDEEGNPMRELVWVSYFTDGGNLTTDLAIVSDPTEGYLGEHDTGWVPPAQPGLVNVWAVARDQRGGSSVIRRVIRVE